MQPLFTRTLGRIRRLARLLQSSQVPHTVTPQILHRQAAVLARLVEEISDVLGERGGGTIGTLLAAVNPLERVQLISCWATSPREGQRLALARAFRHDFDSVGLRSAARHLAHDESPRVRHALARASELRDPGREMADMGLFPAEIRALLGFGALVGQRAFISGAQDMNLSGVRGPLGDFRGLRLLAPAPTL